LKAGDEYYLKVEAETFWKDGFPVQIKLTEKKGDTWYFDTIKMSDLEIEAGQRDVIGMGEEEINRGYFLCY
jgi:hypothetical protein